MATLSSTFYARDTILVARELLGQVLVHETPRGVLSGVIVETEGYLGDDDPASHAFRGPTPRNLPMFGPPGRAYVYFIYGNHFCFNVVAHPLDVPGAVLIRAIEPLDGIPLMRKHRRIADIRNLTNGPGKLTQALAITRRHNNRTLLKGDLRIVAGPPPSSQIVATSRIGVEKGRESHFRFLLAGSPFVSRLPRRGPGTTTLRADRAS